MTISGVARSSPLADAVRQLPRRPLPGAIGANAVRYGARRCIGLLPLLGMIGPLVLPGMVGPGGVRADSPADDLARDFYNSYLDSLPDPRIQRKELLESNLLGSLKRVIPGADPIGGGAAFAEKLEMKDVSYSRVDRTSPFVRGILKELPHLKVEPFMFIARAGPYMAFLCYRADPYRYRVKETDDFHVVRRKEGGEPASPGSNAAPSEKPTGDSDRSHPAGPTSPSAPSSSKAGQP